MRGTYAPTGTRQQGQQTGAVRPVDAAEGDLETVEESIRIHEEKGDLQSGPVEKKTK